MEKKNILLKLNGLDLSNSNINNNNIISIWQDVSNNYLISDINNNIKNYNKLIHKINEKIDEIKNCIINYTSISENEIEKIIKNLIYKYKLENSELNEKSKYINQYDSSNNILNILELKWNEIVNTNSRILCKYLSILIEEKYFILLNITKLNNKQIKYLNKSIKPIELTDNIDLSIIKLNNINNRIINNFFIPIQSIDKIDDNDIKLIKKKLTDSYLMRLQYQNSDNLDLNHKLKQNIYDLDLDIIQNINLIKNKIDNITNI